MQFFLIAPPIIYVIWHWKKIGFALIAILTAASAAIPAGLTYKYGWGASPGVTGENEDRDHPYMEWNYFKPWCRFSPYIVGIFLGYLLHITKGKPFKMSKVANLWGWTIAATTGMAIVYGLDISGAEFFNKKLSMAENIIYGGFHRLAWAIAISWVIFACSRGYGGWINELLSWSAFVPLSRISFIMYLLHVNVADFVFGMYPSNLALTVTTAVIFELGVVGYTALLSVFAYICLELPWLNTEKFIFGLILKPNKK
jgi:peptidoglycan/LPS O-acetylase OafA/YrhL